MKKLLYIFLVPLFFAACDDDAEIIEVRTDVYGAEKLTINIDGVNNDVLIDPSATISNGKTITLNNIIDVNRSIVGEYTGDNIAFNIVNKTARDTSNLKGELKGGKIEITGTVKYTQAGTSRVYSGKTLFINGATPTDKMSAEIKFAGTKEEPDKASIVLTGIVSGSEDDTKAFTVNGKVKKDVDNTFSIGATASDKKVTVTVVGFFIKGWLNITVTTVPVSPTP